MRINKLTLGAIAVALIAIFILGAKFYRHGQATADAASAGGALLIRPHSLTLGPEDAKVTIVEFFDPECESCRAMYPIVKQVMAEFVGRVKLVIRYMPLHQNSAYAATLLEAARAQDKYWEFLDVVMLRQPEWASHSAPRPELLVTYASQAGLDAARLQAAATDPEIRIRILQDQADGTSLKANRTPTFFINGKQLLRLGHAELRAAVQAQLH